MKRTFSVRYFFGAPLLFVLVTSIVFGFSTRSVYASTPFITTWKTDNAGSSLSNQITIPTQGGGYNYTVDWGDASTTTGVTGNTTHTYSVPGTYTVSISGTFPGIYFNNTGDRQKILTIEQWGTNGWTFFQHAFQGASNLTNNAVDTPNLSSVTDMSYLFNGATLWNAPMNAWDVSHVTLMNWLFASDTSFNQSLASWDVSHVTDFSFMFDGASSFNQPLNTWNLSSATLVNWMFAGATVFNQPLSTWDVSHVTDFSHMFEGASSFNQPLNAWNPFRGTLLGGMFKQATAFNQDLNSWSTPSAIDMSDMFSGASSFNGNISAWNTASVTNMSAMFYSAAVFNQNIGSWNTGNVTTMSHMFNGDTAFNQNIGPWNVSNVTNMDTMFGGVSAFNQDLAAWGVSKVTTMAGIFNGASAFNNGGQPLSWDAKLSHVTLMNYMFNGDPAFDQDISSWNVSSVTGMFNMFTGGGLSPVHYDALLIGWASRSVQSSVSFSAGSATYCTGGNSHDLLSGTHGWGISDGGGLCHTLTYTAGTNGAITGTATQSIANRGTGTTVTAVPNTGYSFSSWSDASTTNPRTDTSLTGDVSVTANFITIPVGINNSQPSLHHSGDIRYCSATITTFCHAVQQVVPLPSETQSLQNAQTPSMFPRDLTMKMQGGDVKALQQLLIKLGYPIPAGSTGYFGNQTRSALVAYQLANDVHPASGYFGPLTRKASARDNLKPVHSEMF
jgi:surface protein